MNFLNQFPVRGVRKPLLAFYVQLNRWRISYDTLLASPHLAIERRVKVIHLRPPQLGCCPESGANISVNFWLIFHVRELRDGVCGVTRFEG